MMSPSHVPLLLDHAKSWQCVRHDIDYHVALAIDQQHVSTDKPVTELFRQLRQLRQKRRRHFRQLSGLRVRVIHSQHHALSFSLEDLLAQLLPILALEFSLECAANEVCCFRTEELSTLCIGARVSERELESRSIGVNLFRRAVLRKL